MKLTILTQYYPPEIGAPQARLSNLAKHFVAKGHQVVVLTAMPNYPTGRIQNGYGGFFRREQSESVDVLRTFIYPTQKSDFIHRLGNYFSFVVSSSVCGSFALREADYLMVESPPLFLGLAGFWLSRLKRARLIFNVSDLWPESVASLGMVDRQGMAFRMSERLEEFCYKHAWLITGQSRTIIAEIERRYPELQTFHLSNGVDMQRFEPNQVRPQARAELSSNGNFVVVYAGLHGLAQGLEQVLKAASIVREQHGFQFVLIGDGPEKQMLLAQARSQNLQQVSFFDPRPACEIPNFLTAADAVLVTLKGQITGAVPSKLYEAMACGRPVILVAQGEAAEIVRRHEAGIVVEPGDIQALVQSFTLLRDNPELRFRMGANGRAAVRVHFNRELIASRFINHLENNLNS